MVVNVLGTLDTVAVGATGLTEIMQNVRTILTTPVGSVPLDRDFGVDGQYLDEPQTVVRARMTAAIVEAVEKYEPRVTVENLRWVTVAADGMMVPLVQIRMRDGVEI